MPFFSSLIFCACVCFSLLLLFPVAFVDKEAPSTGSKWRSGGLFQDDDRAFFSHCPWLQASDPTTRAHGYLSETKTRSAFLDGRSCAGVAAPIRLFRACPLFRFGASLPASLSAMRFFCRCHGHLFFALLSASNARTPRDTRPPLFSAWSLWVFYCFNGLGCNKNKERNGVERHGGGGNGTRKASAP